jgi:hypothetical protein
MMVLLDRYGLSLYDIPACGSPELEEDGSQQIVPYWVYEFPPCSPAGDLAVSPVTPQGKVAFLVGKSIFVLSPSLRPEECSVIEYPIGLSDCPRYFPVMGSHHALWARSQTGGSLLEVTTCSFFFDRSKLNGMQRLGHEFCPGTRLRRIFVPMTNKFIGGLAWDEESGRFCVVDWQLNRIIIMDFL